MKVTDVTNSDWCNPQVLKDHYLTKDYLNSARFLGLQAQLGACLEAGKDNTFLEIGPGPGLLNALLKHFGSRTYAVDFANDLRPDVLARLPELPFRNKAFDVVCAFEVLEHIPLELFGRCLREMRRVADKRIILSVPDQEEFHGKRIQIHLRFSRWNYKKSWWHVPFGRLTNPTQHYWEVGFGGVTPQVITDIGKDASLIPVSTYFVSPWFRFFIFDVV